MRFNLRQLDGSNCEHACVDLKKCSLFFLMNGGTTPNGSKTKFPPMNSYDII